MTSLYFLRLARFQVHSYAGFGTNHLYDSSITVVEWMSYMDSLQGECQGDFWLEVFFVKQLSTVPGYRISSLHICPNIGVDICNFTVLYS
jgi:hypothetical protein